jgi:hypothetical protein
MAVWILAEIDGNCGQGSRGYSASDRDIHFLILPGLYPVVPGVHCLKPCGPAAAAADAEPDGADRFQSGAFTAPGYGDRISTLPALKHQQVEILPSIFFQAAPQQTYYFFGHYRPAMFLTNQLCVNFQAGACAFPVHVLHFPKRDPGR